MSVIIPTSFKVTPHFKVTSPYLCMCIYVSFFVNKSHRQIQICICASCLEMDGGDMTTIMIFMSPLDIIANFYL